MRNPFNAGSEINAVAGIPPKNSTAATTNGTGISRKDYMSCALHAACGAATGAPSAQSVIVKLQDSADNSTGWADITGAAATTLVADSTESEVDVNFATVKEYVRAVVIVAFTGGSSPAIPVSATIVLGGSRNLPI